MITVQEFTLFRDWICAGNEELAMVLCNPEGFEIEINKKAPVIYLSAEGPIDLDRPFLKKYMDCPNFDKIIISEEGINYYALTELKFIIPIEFHFKWESYSRGLND